MQIREAFKNYLADFSVKGVPPPLTPLMENHYVKKHLAERGVGLHPPLIGKLPKIFLKNWVKKG